MCEGGGERKEGKEQGRKAVHTIDISISFTANVVTSRAETTYPKSHSKWVSKAHQRDEYTSVCSVREEQDQEQDHEKK